MLRNNYHQRMLPALNWSLTTFHLSTTCLNGHYLDDMFDFLIPMAAQSRERIEGIISLCAVGMQAVYPNGDPFQILSQQVNILCVVAEACIVINFIKCDNVYCLYTNYHNTIDASLVPRLSAGGGERRAWYQLCAHALNFPSFWGTCILPVVFRITLTS